MQIQNAVCFLQKTTKMLLLTACCVSLFAGMLGCDAQPEQPELSAEQTQETAEGTAQEEHKIPDGEKVPRITGWSPYQQVQDPFVRLYKKQARTVPPFYFTQTVTGTTVPGFLRSF